MKSPRGGLTGVDVDGAERKRIVFSLGCLHGVSKEVLGSRCCALLFFCFLLAYGLLEFFL